MRELTILSGLALRTVQEELAKLAHADLIRSWSNGYHRFYRVNRAHLLYLDMLHIVQARPDPAKENALRPRCTPGSQAQRRRTMRNSTGLTSRVQNALLRIGQAMTLFARHRVSSPLPDIDQTIDATDAAPSGPLCLKCDCGDGASRVLSCFQIWNYDAFCAAANLDW